MSLGAHMSVAGGFAKAFERGESIGCETMQIFVTNPNRWQAPPLTDEEVALFREAASASPIRPVIAHDMYLINLCSPDDTLWKRSLRAFQDELERADRLGCCCVVMHPGAHMGAGEEVGLQRLVDALDRLRDAMPDLQVKVALETTAGQGSNLGYRFEHLAEVIARVQDARWLTVCLDTCHVFAAGYELRTAEGYAETWRQFDDIVGIGRLQLIHMNDAKSELGSHVDRHEHIGDGKLGAAAFCQIVNDPRLAHLPMILETPELGDLDIAKRDLDALRSLIADKA